MKHTHTHTHTHARVCPLLHMYPLHTERLNKILISFLPSFSAFRLSISAKQNLSEQKKDKGLEARALDKSSDLDDLGIMGAHARRQQCLLIFHSHWNPQGST